MNNATAEARKNNPDGIFQFERGHAYVFEVVKQKSKRRQSYMIYIMYILISDVSFFESFFGMFEITFMFQSLLQVCGEIIHRLWYFLVGYQSRLVSVLAEQYQRFDFIGILSCRNQKSVWAVVLLAYLAQNRRYGLQKLWCIKDPIISPISVDFERNLEFVVAI